MSRRRSRSRNMSMSPVPSSAARSRRWGTRCSTASPASGGRAKPAPAEPGADTALGLGEFERIDRSFRPLARGMAGALGLADDAALINPGPGRDLVVTTDAMVEGVHYLAGEDPARLARKLLRVNLSDLAAKGAAPLAY